MRSGWSARTSGASAAVEIMTHLQQELEIVNDVVDWSTEGHQPAEFSLPVDQVERRRMIHLRSRSA